MSTTSRFIRNPDIVTREEDQDGGLLFNPDTNHVQVLNPTGLFIWQSCDGNLDLLSLVDQIHDNFEDVPEDVNDQVSAFLDVMVKQGMIGVVDD